MRSIKIGPVALRSLNEMFMYISKDSVPAAHAVGERIKGKIAMLAASPYLGAEVSKKEMPSVKPGLRRLVIPPYVAYYRVFDDTIVVTQILHGRQDARRILSDREDDGGHEEK